MIVGIDPGPNEHGIVFFDGERVVGKANADWDCAVEAINFASLPSDAVIACEMIECFGMPVGREVFQTCVRIGQLLQAFPTMRLIPRRDIKMHLCGTPRAKDPNVRQALIDKLGPVGTKKQPGPCYGVSSHLWSALAVAVTAAENQVTKNEWKLS